MQDPYGLETFSPLPTDRNSALHGGRVLTFWSFETFYRVPRERGCYVTDTGPQCFGKIAHMIGLDLSRKTQLLRLLAVAESKLRALGDKPVWSSYDSGPAIADIVAASRTQIENDAITRAEEIGTLGHLCSNLRLG
ncbi:MAG: hypothetical protein R3C05_03065 [Pirellulaceae bacterium]